MGQPLKYEELSNMTDEQVIARYNGYANPTNVIGFGYWLDELVRRRTEKQTEKMLEATIKMESATQKMLWVAITSVVVSIISIVITLNSGCR